MSEIRIKIDCVIEVPGDGLPALDNPLDLIERGVTVLKATKILPGARVRIGYTRAHAILLRREAKRRQ